MLLIYFHGISQCYLEWSECIDVECIDNKCIIFWHLSTTIKKSAMRDCATSWYQFCSSSSPIMRCISHDHLTSILVCPKSGYHSVTILLAVATSTMLRFLVKLPVATNIGRPFVLWKFDAESTIVMPSCVVRKTCVKKPIHLVPIP